MNTWKAVLLGFFTMVLVWLPFLVKMELPLWKIDFSGGSEVLWKNFDGNNYLVIAKTWYDKEKTGTGFSNPLPNEYYPAHLPLFPAVIWVFDQLVIGPWALLIASLLGTMFCFGVFWKYLLSIDLKKEAFWMLILFSFLPARWLAVRSVGSPEAWFLGFTMLSLMNFKNKKYWLAGLFGALATLTKSPGVLLFGAYGLIFLWDLIKTKKIEWKMWPVALIPFSLVLYFLYVGKVTGDFWAYFNSGDNIHLFFPPFSIFSPQGQAWVGTFWLEEVIWVWVVYGLGVLKLFEKKLRVEAVFAGVFTIVTLFVAHRDIARYILPALPFVLVGWSDTLRDKKTRYLLYFLAIPVLLYTWNFLLHNTAPVADWTPYL